MHEGDALFLAGHPLLTCLVGRLWRFSLEVVPGLDFTLSWG